MTVSSTLVVSIAGQKREHLAIQLMIAQAVLFAVETVAIHVIGGRMSPMLISLLRASGGLALVLVLARSTGAAVFRTRQLGLQLLRGTSTAFYLWVLIYSFAHLPFADAAAISYTHVAYIAVFSMLILGETVSAARWAGAALGIVGALLIAKPSFANSNALYVLVLLGTSLNGLSFVLTKYMQRDDSDLTTMAYTNLVPVLLNLPVLAMGERPPFQAWVWLPAMLVCGPVGMYVGIMALKHARASALGPYTLLRLVISAVGGTLVFHELPDVWGALGAIMILFGCLVSSCPECIRRPGVASL